LDSALEDCLVVVKDDNAVELYHVQQAINDNDTDDGCLTLTCDVVVAVDLLKSLLRDRGKGIYIYICVCHSYSLCVWYHIHVDPNS
jgi:hypothetical protein